MAPDVTYTSTSSKVIDTSVLPSISWNKCVNSFAKSYGELLPFGNLIEVFVRRLLQVVMDNGYVQVTISRPGGHVTGIKYGGMDNVLESTNSETNRGYWDLNWNEVDGSDTYDAPSATQYKVVESNGDKVELSFTRPYDSSRSPAMVPLTIDKRFVLVRGHSGFYTYAIYSRSSGWPDFDMGQTRVCFKLRETDFHYIALADNKIKLMPEPSDLSDARSEQLAYKEARLLTNPKNSALKGQVDDKYQYALNNRDNKVHGWVANESDPVVGFWMITASNEFRNGGPTKQDLTSHSGPTCLGLLLAASLAQMFHSAHFAGIELCPQFRDGESWKKVFGPVYVYLNKKAAGTAVRALWDDAKAELKKELNAWPYSWPSSSDYPKSASRAQVKGRLIVSDKYAKSKTSSARDALVGLAKPGAAGSWQKESKGYQFWVQADQDGNFTIKHVRAGTYSLFAFVPSVIGDYKKSGDIKVSAGEEISLGTLTYEPPRFGPTSWEIGTPSRTAAEFYIPDPNPKYPNSLYVDTEKWRNYGLWARYSELYPSQDLVYTVGTSDYKKDWYFAHNTRRHSDGTYTATRWQIKFELSSFDESKGAYKLRMAIAQAQVSAIQVRVNDVSSKPVYETPAFGKDNAIARHGIQGIYVLYNIDIPAADLKKGSNSIYLTQRKASGPYNGVMYDYLRLEAPPS
ncbi:rhamnogalacturonan endolyase [Marchantia polymorpha subsp. ruderalis]|uniref:rhamnogalacturonan endolyase n=1 Tax=Marchantia polymorpha subsp. ruderalis TaxID=1480154 RepID=A0AAF6BLG3_MARPO|nr:hypothetical protein Mp_5g23370 [Marchantia polymorpha subsp. ruderalis]